MSGLTWHVRNPSSCCLQQAQCLTHLTTYSIEGPTFSSRSKKIIQMEINKLLIARFIREVKYLDWLANVMVVPKKWGKLEVCVDYTNLNDAYLKNSFPLPRIDQTVDATTRHEMFSFLDVFFGYHQILMLLTNEKKTTFVTPQGLHCYRVMPFGLKNVGATYQRLLT